MTQITLLLLIILIQATRADSCNQHITPYCSDCTQDHQNCKQCQHTTNIRVLPNYVQIPNCIKATLNQQLICQQCQKYYYLQSNQCFTCPNKCILCNSITCLTCDLQYYIDSSTCYPCPKQCATCESNSTHTCTSCNLGFYLEQETKSCESTNPSIENCKIFSSISNCEICFPTYVKPLCKSQCSIIGCFQCQDSENICSTCHQLGYATIPIEQGLICKSCRTINENCFICNNQGTICTQCYEGYYAMERKCIQCTIEFCQDCSSNDKCKKCIENYDFLNSSESICIRCPQNVLNCSTDKCLRDGFLQNRQLLGGLNSTSGSGSGDGSSWSVSLSYLSMYITCPKSLKPYCNGCYQQDSIINCTNCRNNGITIPNYSQFNSQCIEARFGIIGANLHCVECNKGFFITHQYQCSPCPTNCSICLFPSCLAETCAQCTTCFPGSYLVGNTKKYGQLVGSCQKCSNGCSSCINSLNCNKCFQLYYLDPASSECEISVPENKNCKKFSNTKTCSICFQNYALPSCQLPCQIAGCIECQSSVETCTLCNANGYATNIQTVGTTISCKACNLIDQNCLSCGKNASNCTKCLAGYYLTKTSSCLTCNIPNCASCLSQTQCLICNTNYDLYDDLGQECQICPETYLGCSSKKCLQDLKSSYLQNSFCTQMNSSNDCQSCNSANNPRVIGNYLKIPFCSVATQTNSNLACTQCNNGYYINENSECMKCNVANCKTCSKVFISTCTTCNKGYFAYQETICQAVTQVAGCDTYNESNGECSYCIEGYIKSYFVNGCLSCISNCKRCINEGQCEQCNNGYLLDEGSKTCLIDSEIITCGKGNYKDSQGDCQKCVINNCLECSSSSTCTLCKQNYDYLKDGDQCQKCPDSSINGLSCTSQKCIDDYNNNEMNAQAEVQNYFNPVVQINNGIKIICLMILMVLLI